MLKKILYRLAPSPIKEKLRQLAIRQYQNKIANKTVEEVFEYIYQEKIWGKKESISGGGSSYQHTQTILTALPKLLKQYKIKTILDLPCGDFNWMQHIDLEGITYIGGDIVKALIDSNTVKHERKNIHFQQLNIIKDPLPAADLLICRDCLVHLSIEQIKLSLTNIKAHSIQYLLVTSFPKTTTNIDILPGEWRKVNLELPPFNLQPIATIREEKGGGSDKSLLLVDLRSQGSGVRGQGSGVRRGKK
jgi:hypothetical protein